MRGVKPHLKAVQQPSLMQGVGSFTWRHRILKRHGILRDETVRGGLALQGAGAVRLHVSTLREFTTEVVTHAGRHIHVHTAVDDCGGLNCSHAGVSGDLLTIHYVWSIV